MTSSAPGQSPSTEQRLQGAEPLPPRKIHWMVWIIYAVLAVIFIALPFFFEVWWHKLAAIAAGIFAALQIIRAETQQKEIILGKCIYCGHELHVADRECPKCERTVPREMRPKEGPQV